MEPFLFLACFLVGFVSLGLLEDHPARSCTCRVSGSVMDSSRCPHAQGRVIGSIHVVMTLVLL